MKVISSMIGRQEVLTVLISNGTRYKLRREASAPFKWNAYDHQGEVVQGPSAYREELVEALRLHHGKN